MQNEFPLIYKFLSENVGMVSAEEILRGWSDDRKYRITTKNGEKYLLRISSVEKTENKRKFYRLSKQAAELGISMSIPVLFNGCEDGCYGLYSWIDGFDANEVIGRFSASEQYSYGVEAGRILKKIHTIPAPEESESWEIRFNRKIDAKLEMYSRCELKYDDDACLINYIRDNRALLRSRPQCYQHGDYHIGNMMIGMDGKLYIIDFDRDDYGDPWEEFNRIVWSAQASPLFASGLVDGYFDENIPEEFWKLLALYISAGSLGSLPWAVPFGQEEVEVMQAQQRDIIAWYDHMKNVVPAWYGKPEDSTV